MKLDAAIAFETENSFGEIARIVLQGDHERKKKGLEIRGSGQRGKKINQVNQSKAALIWQPMVQVHLAEQRAAVSCCHQRQSAG